MPVLIELDFVGVTAEQYDTVNDRVGTRSDHIPDGLLFHSAVASDAGIHIVDLWESPAAFQAFMQAAAPTFQEAGVPEPKSPPQPAEVHNHYLRP